MSKRIEKPYTNKFGTLNPGDKCIAVTVSTQRVRVTEAEYVGYIERSDWRGGNPQQFVQVKRPAKIFEGVFYKGTDEPAGWPRDPDREVEYRSREGFKISTLQYNRVFPLPVSTDDLMTHINNL